MASKNFNLGLLSDGLYVDPTTLNVGIGNTASGGYKLDVTGTGRFSGALTGTSATFSGLVTINKDVVAISGSPLVSTNSTQINLTSSGANLSVGIDNSTGTFMLASGGQAYGSIISTNNATPLILGTNLNARLTITSSGNVGIGTSSPISGGGLSRWITLDGTYYGGGFISSVNGTAKSYMYYDNLVNLHTIQGAAGVGVMISTDNTERMRITSGGNVQIGGTVTTSRLGVTDSVKSGTDVPFTLSSNDGSTSMQLYFQRNQSVSYHIQAVEQGISYRALYLNPNGGAVYAGGVRLDTLSDKRVKDNIQPINNALSKVLSITGKKFHLKDEEDGKLRYGFIAQELEGVLDEFVVQTSMTFKKDDIEVENVKSIENWASSWAALLVEAMKEQQTQIEELRQIVATK